VHLVVNWYLTPLISSDTFDLVQFSSLTMTVLSFLRWIQHGRVRAAENGGDPVHTHRPPVQQMVNRYRTF